MRATLIFVLQVANAPLAIGGISLGMRRGIFPIYCVKKAKKILHPSDATPLLMRQCLCGTLSAVYSDFLCILDQFYQAQIKDMSKRRIERHVYARAVIRIRCVYVQCKKKEPDTSGSLRYALKRHTAIRTIIVLTVGHNAS